MNVVCDTSALIALSRINALGLLERQFTRLIIPDAVYEEIPIGKNKPGIKEIAQAGWVQKKTVKDRTSVERLSQSLHRGEAEVIALAKEIGADLVILDDAYARKMAEAEGLNVVGLLAVLVNAKQKGLIAEIRLLLDELKQKGFFIEDELYRLLLHKAGE